MEGRKATMLINFTFSNYKVYRETAEFSMVAGRFQKHRESLMGIPGERYAKLLPIAAIYGGNASGKTSFVQAIKCLRSIVLQGKPSLAEPHLFDKNPAPTRFVCCFSVGNHVFEYEVHISSGSVVYECLTDATKGSNKIIFKRVPGQECELGNHIDNDPTDSELLFAKKIGSTLPAGELLITTVIKLQVAALHQHVIPCYKWFAKTLCIIEADSRRVGLGLDLFTQLSGYSTALAQADTGVEQLQFQEVNANIEDVVPTHVLDKFKESDENILVIPDDNSTLLVKDAAGGIKLIKCYSTYTSEDGNQTMIPLSKESDGTRRYLHLLPILMDKQVERVYVVDELDRSLHTTLSRSLIKSFRNMVGQESCRQQLIFTTHDVMLMDEDNLRKDEIWVTERDDDHQAHLFSFAEYKDIRPDLQMRKSYLEGRMGGLPKIECCL